MSVQSTFPVAKANLITQLQAIPAMSGVQVSYGMPRAEPDVEWIWVGGGRPDGGPNAQFPSGQSAAALGQARREERYGIDVVVSVLKSGSDQQAATERAFAIAGLIETQLRAEATLAGAVRWAQVTSLIGTEHYDDSSREGRVAMVIFCGARI